MINLKMFLKYRDTAPEFKGIREGGRVGLPCIVVNSGESIVFDYTTLDIDQIKEV